MTLKANKSHVLQHYPNAGPQFLKAISGACHPHDKDHWRIFQELADIAASIGIGQTEEAAWKDAANRLKSTQS
jgi:hypothetical protein